MALDLSGNGIPVGIGYDTNGDPKGFIELTTLSSVNVDLVHTDVSTTPYTVLDSDRLIYVSSNIDVTVNLPSAEENTYRVLDIHNSGSTNQVSIDAGDSTINGDGTKILQFQYDTVTLHCNGSEWFIL